MFVWWSDRHLPLCFWVVLKDLNVSGWGSDRHLPLCFRVVLKDLNVSGWGSDRHLRYVLGLF